jgi:xanthine dehydrogenase molybdenum-binding subunit
MAQPFTQRTPRQFVGGYRPRIDGRAKASGQAEYLDDVAAGLKGVIHARALRSPYPHARIKHMDTSRAESLPGVRCVLRFDDPEVAAFPPTALGWTSTNSNPYDKMYYPLVKDVRVLDSTARWVGDEAGVIVAADSEEILEEALALIEVEWEQLPFVLDRHEAMGTEAPILHPEVNPTGNVLPPDEFCGPDVFYDKGNVVDGMGEADEVVEVEAHYARSDHSALDTRGCLMQWKNGKLTCWTNFYAADQTRMHLSQMLGLPMNRVRVVLPYIGGNFGRCNMGEQPFFLETALLAQRTGRPVRYKMTRREDFHDTRNAIDYKVRVGAKRDGTIVAADFDSLLDTGAYHGHGLAVTKWVVSLDVVENLMAHIPNLRYESYVVYTNKVPGGCMRGAGNVQHNFAWGLAVDALADKLGLDPVDVYLKNCGHEWEQLPGASMAAVLETGAQRIGWAERHKPGQGPLLDGTKKRGMGLSCHCSWHAPYQEMWRGHVQVEVKLNPDMSVILKAPQGETGTGSNSCVTFACAEALSYLGIGVDDIQWIPGADTESGLKDMVQTDSCCAFLQSDLMPLAAAQLKETILELAAPIMEVPAAELDIADGQVFVKSDPGNAKTVRDVLWSGDFVPLVATVSKLPAPEKTGAPMFAAFAEVEVDIETGVVDVLKVVVVNDCGTVMFGSGAEGQQIGGQCLSLGEAVTEEMIYDEATGVPLNFNWVDYHVPTMLDFPEVEPVLLEVWKGAGEYGACGMGEGTGTCTPRAIYNAVYNAVGVRIEDMPLSPDRVLRALGDLPSGREGAR